MITTSLTIHCHKDDSRPSRLTEVTSWGSSESADAEVIWRVSGSMRSAARSGTWKAGRLKRAGVPVVSLKSAWGKVWFVVGNEVDEGLVARVSRVPSNKKHTKIGYDNYHPKHSRRVQQVVFWTSPWERRCKLDRSFLADVLLATDFARICSISLTVTSWLLLVRKDTNTPNTKGKKSLYRSCNIAMDPKCNHLISVGPGV